MYALPSEGYPKYKIFVSFLKVQVNVCTSKEMLPKVESIYFPF